MAILAVSGLILFVGLFMFWMHDKKPRTCAQCKFWDHQAGQASLRRSPTFSAVMTVLSPNDEFGKQVVETSVDDEGQEVRKVTRLPVFSAFENRWEYFGGCTAPQQESLRHRTDTCDKFNRR